MALACDLIVASTQSIFSLPEPKVDLIAIGGGIHRFVRQVGFKRAMGPLLTGQTIDASHGYEMGFVSELCASEELDAKVDELSARIVANAPLEVQATKALAMWGLDQPRLSEALQWQSDQPAFQSWQVSEDAVEGPRDFSEKRKPAWKGRWPGYPVLRSDARNACSTSN